MSKQGREGAHSDEQLLAALDRLVQLEGIVKAGELLGVTYRTASTCQESRQVSRRMRQVLEKHLREREQGEPEEEAGEEQTVASLSNESDAQPVSRLQEAEHELGREVEALRAEVADLRERLEAIEGWPERGPGNDVDGADEDDVDLGEDEEQERSVVAPRRVFPELVTESAESGEEVVYGVATELIVAWREAWSERESARHTLAWLRTERLRLQLESRLIGEFGLTPPPADAPWRERRRERELDWRRRALRRLRWQLPLTWSLHWMLRVLSLGVWGR